MCLASDITPFLPFHLAQAEEFFSLVLSFSSLRTPLPRYSSLLLSRGMAGFVRANVIMVSLNSTAVEAFRA